MIVNGFFDLLMIIKIKPVNLFCKKKLFYITQKIDTHAYVYINIYTCVFVGLYSKFKWILTVNVTKTNYNVSLPLYTCSLVFKLQELIKSRIGFCVFHNTVEARTMRSLRWERGS